MNGFSQYGVSIVNGFHRSASNGTGPERVVARTPLLHYENRTMVILRPVVPSDFFNEMTPGRARKAPSKSFRGHHTFPRGYRPFSFCVFIYLSYQSGTRETAICLNLLGLKAENCVFCQSAAAPRVSAEEHL